MRTDSIDRRLPPMQCDDNCGECCGIVPVSEAEYLRVMAYAEARGITPVKQGSTCPWFQSGRCSVHEARPTICRLYGHVEGMTCPRGYNANIDGETERRIMRDYSDEVRVSGFRHLHDAVYTEDEIVGLITAEVAGTTPLTLAGKAVEQSKREEASNG